MSLQIGIVGLPNVGKSTLFNALTQAGAAVASYPFTTIEPNVGVATVQDQRLEDIAALVKPERAVPATVEFLDIAGLVRGAHKGEGLGNQFLGHIRTVDAIALVGRCFRDPDVPHVTAELNPIEDLETIDLELILADLATVERRLEKVGKMAKGRSTQYELELTVLTRLRDCLDRGQKAQGLAMTTKEAKIAASLNLLTAKPRLYVANVGEEDLPHGGKLAAQVRKVTRSEETSMVVICAQVEADLNEWPPDEATEYRRTLGLNKSGLETVIQAGYELLELITFFTATGKREVRAWPIPKGTRALQAAGKVHTDMERGFIRAEVVPYADLVTAGSLVVAREKGLMRLEGKDYTVQDGDVIHFRFNV